MLYQRTINNQIIDFINDSSKHKNVLILNGPRQVGKSTALNELIKNKPHLLIHFEKSPSLASEIDQCANFEEFNLYLKEKHHFKPDEQILVFDEAQQSRKLGSFVRFMKEEWNQATVILTGSTISELHQETERQPVGRESFLEMGPLGFVEFLKALEQDSLSTLIENYKIGQEISESQHHRCIEMFDAYLRVGGLPEVITFYKEKKDFKKLREDIFKAYENDFVRYYSLEDINLFKRCMETVATHAGSPSKDSQAIRVDAPGYKKIAGIFSRLEKWGLIHKCPQWGIEPETNFYHPKRYLYDLGILADLRLKGISSISLNDISSPVLRTPLGGIIENALALSLKQQFENVFGIRLSPKSEIDFAIKYKETVFPIECKISQRFKQNFTFAISDYFKRTQKTSMGFLFYGGKPVLDQSKNLVALPFYLSDGLKNILDNQA